MLLSRQRWEILEGQQGGKNLLGLSKLYLLREWRIPGPNPFHLELFTDPMAHSWLSRGGTHPALAWLETATQRKAHDISTLNVHLTRCFLTQELILNPLLSVKNICLVSEQQDGPWMVLHPSNSEFSNHQEFLHQYSHGTQLKLWKEEAF